MLFVSRERAPALGDIREVDPGTVIFVAQDSIYRADWSRYWDALRVAHTRGAEIRWV